MIDADPAIQDVLDELVVNCPELIELENHLSRFNIFRTLGAERNELRHSNMLAWLLSPDAEHGLDDLFLRRWLMSVLVAARDSSDLPYSPPPPASVDVLDFDEVEIHREFDRIDLLISLRMRDGSIWVICIENKVEASQGENQLKDYYDRIEEYFPEADHRLYVFLTKREEAPNHSAFVDTTYAEILRVLGQCLDERETQIGPDPLFLIRHYRQLLEDAFVVENHTIELAKKIYSKHKVALDYIYENKPNSFLAQATEALEKSLKEGEAKPESKLDIKYLHSQPTTGLVKFLPKEWAVEANKRQGGAIAGNHYIYCEVDLKGKRADIFFCLAYAPEEWEDKVWERAETHPFNRKMKRATKYPKIFHESKPLSIADVETVGAEKLAQDLGKWVAEVVRSPRFKEANRVIAVLLEQLGGEVQSQLVSD
jgi:hypothetical protein